jgi:hypothetical protein
VTTKLVEKPTRGFDFDPADMTMLFTADTGLPFVVSIRPRWGAPHDARVKAWPEHGDNLHRHRGGWVSVRVRPQPRQIPRGRHRLSSDDAELVYRWIHLNEPVIMEFWEGRILSERELLARLRPLSPPVPP